MKVKVSEFDIKVMSNLIIEIDKRNIIINIK